MAEIIKINENTWRIEDGHVRLFLLEGSEKALLIDSGMTLPEAREIASTITSLPLELLNTHADPDHISGNSSFSEFYMNPDEKENYELHNGKGTIKPVHEGDIIDLGGRPLTIYDLPGHTPGSIAILDINSRMLISGDSIQNGTIFMFGEMRNMPLYIESLKALTRIDGLYDQILPSHGAIPVDPSLISKLICGAEQILKGEVAGHREVVHGTPVIQYDFDFAGFYCDIPEENQ